MWKQVMEKLQILATCLGTIMMGGWGVCGGCGGRGAGPESLITNREGPRCDRWGFDPVTKDSGFPQPVSPVPPTPPDCDSDQCGLNGMWFGQGFRFRELHMDGSTNGQGLALVGIVPKGGQEVMHLGIRRDELLIRDRQSGVILMDGKKLEGAKILIESPSMMLPAGTRQLFEPRKKDPNLVPQQFELEILNVSRQEFWDCAGSTDCDKAFHYEFVARTNADGGCRVQVCAPSLARNLLNTDVQGTAIVFAGDLYDDHKFNIKSDSYGPSCQKTELSSVEQGTVNFACTGTVVSKLHMLRHTSASSREGKHTTVPQREAMLRMLTADYCGIGRSFTRNGTPINFHVIHGQSFEGYESATHEPLEAIWTNQGASCIGTPRLAEHSYEEIESFCESNHVPAPPRCFDPTLNPGVLSALGPVTGAGAGSPAFKFPACAGTDNYLISNLPAQ
jgi:ADYC domain-containing protein